MLINLPTKQSVPFLWTDETNDTKPHNLKVGDKVFTKAHGIIIIIVSSN